ncbi:MAG: arylsulfatase [Phycisphaerales bacterium]|nr:MAG: arylsulfatase [Phycisphaerales bacterium]
MSNLNWTRRDLLKATGTLAAAWTLAGFKANLSMAENEATSGATQPNVVFILADDMGYGDIQALNPQSRIPTPHLNKLASEGVVFTDAHSGSAVCTPTRYGVVTGRYCWRSRLKRGVLNGYSSHLIDPERLTVANVMKRSGYHTACIGKWHLGMDLPVTEENGQRRIDHTRPIENGPNALGFDYFFGVTASLDMPPYVFVENDRFPQPVTAHYEKTSFPNYSRAGLMAADFSHEKALDQLTRKAVDYIDARSKDQQPFFLYFPLTAPHKPCLPAARFRGNTDLGDYGDFVTQVDWVVGQVDKALKANGLTDNTLLIYTSDNGSYMYRWDEDKPDHVTEPSVQGFHPQKHQANYIWRGTKADIWEAGHHVPYLVRWPGVVQPGAKCDETICLTDLMATLAEITGFQLPGNAAEDSFSLVPLLQGRKPPTPRAPVIHHSGSGMFSLREGKWKMVFGNGSGGRQRPRGKPFEKPYFLVDLEQDPLETTNVIEAHPEIAQRLTERLETIMDSGRSRPL